MIVSIDHLDDIDHAVVLMSGTDPDGRRVQVAVDRRQAFDISCMLDADHLPVPVSVEPWQVMSGNTEAETIQREAAQAIRLAFVRGIQRPGGDSAA